MKHWDVLMPKTRFPEARNLTADEIMAAFQAEAAGDLHTAARIDPQGSWRRAVRESLPQGVTVSKAIASGDTKVWIESVKAREEQKQRKFEAAMREADEQLRAIEEGKQRAKSGEWVLVVRRGAGIYEGWLDERWFRSAVNLKNHVVLWDGDARKRVEGQEITKAKAADLLMSQAEKRPVHDYWKAVPNWSEAYMRPILNATPMFINRDFKATINTTP